MKILKLTNTPECLRIAQAFVGSECFIEGNDYQLIGLVRDYFGVIEKLNNYQLVDLVRDYFRAIEKLNNNEHEVLEYSSEILLPLETLKICPFIAMREGLKFIVNNKSCIFDECYNFGDDDIWFRFKPNMFRYCVKAKNLFVEPKYLDLDWIQTIPGASIEEIE